jgi:chromatin remodeling complex protein RSC6
MARRREIEKRVILPDPKIQDVLGDQVHQRHDVRWRGVGC